MCVYYKGHWPMRTHWQGDILSLCSDNDVDIDFFIVFQVHFLAVLVQNKWPTGQPLLYQSILFHTNEVLSNINVFSSILYHTYDHIIVIF